MEQSIREKTREANTFYWMCVHVRKRESGRQREGMRDGDKGKEIDTRREKEENTSRSTSACVCVSKRETSALGKQSVKGIL